MSFITFFTSPLFKWLAIIALALGLIFGIYHTGYKNGENAQKITYVKEQQKAETVVLNKNTAAQAATDSTEKTIIVYRDRVVTKYKTIIKDVSNYEKSPLSSSAIDADFVRLHDTAAISATVNPITPTPTSSGVDGDSSSIGDAEKPAEPTTTGTAIKVITDNYEQYALCRNQVIQWNQFYSKLLNDVNK